MRTQVQRGAARALGCVAVAATAVAAAWSYQRPPRRPLGSLRPAAAPVSETQTVKPVSLLAVGDLMLGTSVKSRLTSEGPRSLFSPYRASLAAADLTFGNLETPLSDGGSPTPGKSPESLRNRTNYLFRAPPLAAEGLAWAGFDVLSVANNHTMDYGEEALRDTLSALTDAGIESVGAGENIAAAGAPALLERGGQRLAFFGLSDVLPAFSAADSSRGGVAPARGAWFDRAMPDAIARARRQADWVIVSVHWGRESFPGATSRQRSLGRRLIDWGADVVIGHHTHCLGPVERYRAGVIHYSLGNAIHPRPDPRGMPAWEVTFRPDSPPSARSRFLRPARRRDAGPGRSAGAAR